MSKTGSTKTRTPGNRQSECEKALTRAHEAGIQIAGRGHRKQDGATVYAVTSASEVNRLYAVVVLPARIECPCAHAKHGGYCMHRALVHELLEIERDREAEEARWALTPSGSAQLAAWRAEREQRETSMPRQRAAFSLLK